jgi:shikimate dehydrogenase
VVNDPAPGPGARAAGVMGSPIAHSLSPALHRAAYRSLGLTGWTYDAREVDQAGLPGALERLGPEWVGVSLTMPLKHAVLPLLDAISPLAAEVGAVNTLTLRAGRRLGDNTDVQGIVAALGSAGVTDATGAAVLGGGATAASALAALRELGERQPLVVVRSTARATELLSAAERLGVRPRLIGWDEAARTVADAPVVVSTVPRGAADLLAGETGVRREGAIAGVLLDVVYRPWPTPLAVAWTSAGGVAVAGLEMLLHQAIAQVRAWTGGRPDPDAMRSAALAVLRADEPAGPGGDGAIQKDTR